MSSGQEHNNRSQGQRIRRANENIAALAEGQERTAELLAQHDRDLKLLRARVSALESERSRR